MLKYLAKIPPAKKTEDIWIYQLEPANSIVGAVLMVLLTVFFIIFAIQKDLNLRKDHYLFFLGGISIISLLLTKKKVLEINRKDKIIKTSSKILFFKKNKIQPLTDFDSVNLSPKTETIDEGYLNIVYSLVLSGPGASIETVSLHDKEEAKKHLHELSTFLNLRAENTPAKL